jgi:hypothetical protein
MCRGNRASLAVFATIATFLTVTPAVLVVVLLAEPLLALRAAPSSSFSPSYSNASVWLPLPPPVQPS